MGSRGGGEDGWGEWGELDGGGGGGGIYINLVNLGQFESIYLPILNDFQYKP